MYIADILYYSKEDSEAEVCVTDGCYTVNCYAYPCGTMSVNQRINTIYGFGCANISKMDRAQYSIQKLPQHFAYQLIAQVVDNEKGDVCIGELFISLDSPIPKDITNGEYVSFSVMRLDCD